MDCGRVNVFIGPLNTGKSNILEAIGLALLLYYGGWLCDFVRVLKPRDLFFCYDVSKPIELLFDGFRLSCSYRDGSVEFGVRLPGDTEVLLAGALTAA